MRTSLAKWYQAPFGPFPPARQSALPHTLLNTFGTQGVSVSHSAFAYICSWFYAARSDLTCSFARILWPGFKSFKFKFLPPCGVKVRRALGRCGVTCDI